MSVAHRPRGECTLAAAVRTAMLSFALVTASATAWATAPQQLDAVASKTYDIPAGPLGRALSSFAMASGIALSFEPATPWSNGWPTTVRA